MARRAGAEVAQGIGYYRWGAILNLLTQGVALAAGLAYPAVAASESLSAVGSSSGAATATSLGGPGEGLLILTSLLGLGLLGLNIAAFLKWRSGVRRLGDGVPLGTFFPGGAAADAETGYRWSVWAILGIVVATIVGTVTIIAVVLGSLTSTAGSSGATTAPTTAEVHRAVIAAIPAIAGLALVLLALVLVLAYSVTRSLDGFAALAAPMGSPDRSAVARGLVYGSVLLAAGGGLNLVAFGIGSACQIGGALLLLLACQQYLGILRAPGP